ncbi:MAG: SusC/RagA family TonB-linked outer membrane protein [Bacteroidales bacterium]|nr:SusC/RagA family TonB-linked outer membrane protein [Bacteroidales bacterium]MDD2322709.1 SusC/RagA family TonB-linked outer membrane protein [Bacteroidales bacterium]MDD3960322.1 SusC/RagA family TonB-linked outer membrane protein [Bacteroidales bacterium]MDY0285696.1 SusC/RagA family TonB-linked outer membrane protein [Bacteroidales bacterium]
MRKFTALIALIFLCGVQLVFAQRTITGTITHADNGDVIPGATIRIQGTTLGTVADLDGKYEVKVPESATTLIFSFVGMVTQQITIGDESVINVVLESDIQDIQGVVVTALGISRDKKALGYAVQNVDGDALTKARDNNPLGQLAGKVAGVQISGSSGNMGGSNRILIRGANSVTGENQPLFVIDGVPMDNSNFNSTDAARGAGGIDYGNMANDINPDDIESMSILKGPSAAALYGSRGANGVIMITTKKGPKGKKGIGVSVNSGVAFETVGLLPTYQTSYGGGYGPFDEAEIDGKMRLLPGYAIDESWGPKYEDQSVVHWFNLSDWEAAGKPAGGLTEDPWRTPENDVKSFFETGVTWTNNVAVTGANDAGSFRLSYTNMTSDGYMPNSQLDKNTVNFSGAHKLGDKLHASAVMTYIRTDAMGRAYTGYDDNNVMQKFTQWGQRQLDMVRLSDYVNPDGTQRVWNRGAWDNPNPEYSNNPYWTAYRNYTTDSRDRVYGNMGLVYDITDFLKVKGTMYTDFYTFRNHERIAIGSQETPYYSEGIRQYQENNYEALLMFDKQLNEDFSLKLNAGGNVRKSNYFRNIGQTSGGLVLPELYTLANSVDPVVIDDYNNKKQVNSVLGSASLGWKYMLYLDLTARNDWSSTLPMENNSYFYPSVTGTFVFSEMDALADAEWLSFGKIRAGWASVGNDTDPYNLTETYTNYAPNFNGVPRYSVPNSLPNNNLLPERTNSWEVGAEMSFLNNRMGLDVTYYNMLTNDLITQIDITAASGYTSKWINAGQMSNKGIELMLSGAPVRNDNFEWNIAFNFSKNNNELLELYQDIENYRLINGPFKVTVNASVGQPYGVLMGSDFIRDDEGNKLVSTTGRWRKTTSTNEVLGSVMPNYNLGIINNFKIFGADLGFVIDIQNGGSYFSTSYMWGMYSGMLEESVWYDDYESMDVTPADPDGQDIREGGVILNGVYGYYDEATETVVYTDAEGNIVDTPVANETAISGERWCSDFYSSADAQEVFDASYIKLREVTLGYTLPKKLTGPINNLRIAAYGRNLMIWGLDNRHFDPEAAVTSSGNIQGIEGAAMPSMRNFGINLSFNF